MSHRTPSRTRGPFTRILLNGLICLTFAACTTSSNALAPDDEPQDEGPPPPAIVEMAPTDLPAFDRELYKTSCQSTSGLCPVLRWDGVDYVALSYRDNRFSFAIHAFSADGALRGLREETGARYLSALQIDGEARTVAFVGQAERSVLLGWDTLQQIR